MNKYSNYIMGLICGIVLMILNSEIAQNTINSVFTLFNNNDINPVFIFAVTWASRLAILLSFIGIIILIYYSILIMNLVIKESKKNK